MNRKQLMWLDKWLSKNNRKPLVVRGARQVGKSTLVELFSQQFKGDEFKGDGGIIL
jgi:predicted AAA+ superfamily ATPase